MKIRIDDKKLILALISISLLIAPVVGAPAQKFDVVFELSEESPSHVCFDDYITNLQDVNDDFPYKAVLNETNIDLSHVAVKFYEWKPKDVEVTTHSMMCNPYLSLNLTTIDNCTRVPQTSVEVQWHWLERSLTSNIVDGTTLRNQWEEVSIKKDETKRFRRCYYFPMTRNGDGWGSYGSTYVEASGETYYDFTHSSWWSSNWGYKKNITITLQDETINYENYFMNISVDLLTLVSAGKLETDWTDLRIVDESNNVVERKVIQPPSGNATVWFNFTNVSAGATYYQMFYGYASATAPDVENFTNWVAGGWDFDQYVNNTAIDDVDTCTLNCTIVDGGWSSGTPSNNYSLQVDGINSIFRHQMNKIQQGKYQFNIRFNSIGDEGLIGLLDSGSKYVARYWVDGTRLKYYDGATDTTWFYPALDENYTFIHDIDITSGEWNVTVWNSSWTDTVNLLDVGTSGAVDASNIYIKTYDVNGDYIFDDFILRNTSGVYKEPLHDIDAEQSRPISTIGPQYSGNFTDPVTPQVWTGSKKYGFQIDWERTDNVTFESDFNGTKGNHSYYGGNIKNTSTTTYWINFTDENMTVASHDYRWYAANNSNENKTDVIVYTTTAAVGTSIDMWLNGTLNADKADTWPADTNCTCKINRATQNTFTMTRNGTVIGTQAGQTITYSDDLDGGGYNFSCNYTEQNYSSYATDNTFTLTGLTTSIDLFINGSASSQTLLNGTAINFTAITDQTGYTINISTNLTGWGTQSDTTTISNITVWNISGMPKQYNITAFMNSLNFTNSFKTWFLTLDDVEVDAEIYEVDILENSEQTISAIFGYPVGAEDLYGTLIWNDTVYTNDTVTMNSTHITLGKTFTVPDIEEATEDINFFWNYSYDSHDHINLTSTSHLQQIQIPTIGRCNNTWNNTSIVVNFFNENETTFPIVNVTADIYLSFAVGAASYTYNNSFTNESIDLCIFPSWSNFSVDGEITYTNASFTSRIYTFDDDVFDNVTDTLDLLLIDATDAPKLTRIGVKDEYGNAYSDVVVKAQRWYNGLGVYKTAAAPITDITGNAFTYLELDDAEYRFLMYQNGALLKTIPKMIIPNVASEDPIILDFMITFDEIIEWLIYKDKIAGTCSYANSTGNLTCSYEDTSNAIKLSEVRLVVTKYTGALESNEIYDGINTSVPTGSFIVHLDNTTVTTSSFSYTMTGKLNINQNEWFVIYSGWLEEGEGRSILFGDCKAAANLIKCREGAIMTFFLTLTSALVGVSLSPAVSIVMMLAGLGVASAVGLWAISSQTMIGTVLVAAILLYRMRSR